MALVGRNVFVYPYEYVGVNGQLMANVTAVGVVDNQATEQAVSNQIRAPGWRCLQSSVGTPVQMVECSLVVAFVYVRLVGPENAVRI